MPEGVGYGSDRVARLFAYRLARRRGEMEGGDPDIDAYGESLGVAGMSQPQAAPQAPAQPPQVATMQTQRDTGIPALDALANVPKQRSRGLVHDKRMGRVVKGGM